MAEYWNSVPVSDIKFAIPFLFLAVKTTLNKVYFTMSFSQINCKRTLYKKMAFLISGMHRKCRHLSIRADVRVGVNIRQV